MFDADLKTKPDGVFKRLTGVRLATFHEMCQALKTHLPVRGRKPKPSVEDRLLLTLMYWREYRPYVHIAHVHIAHVHIAHVHIAHVHIAQTYGLSESAVCRTVHAIETALLRSGQFTLPGKKALTKTDIAFEGVGVDATECPVERPKKNNGTGTAARRSAIPKKPKSSPIQRQSA